MPEAARLGDPITHTNALTGLLVGLFVGAVAGVAFGLVTVLSGGTALALLPAVIAVVSRWRGAGSSCGASAGWSVIGSLVAGGTWRSDGAAGVRIQGDVKIF